MTTLLKLWLGIKSDRRAVTALEYGLIAAVVGAVMVVGATTLGTSLSGKFSVLAGSL
jgi:pilus assembly protein Flp/PilA